MSTGKNKSCFVAFQVNEYIFVLGCAPPPGAYDPQQKDKPAGGVVDKSQRFKTLKGVASIWVIDTHDSHE